MHELPIYQVTVRIDSGAWIRCFAGQPTRAEILSALTKDQSDLASDETGGIRWGTYDNWMTLVRNHDLPKTPDTSQACMYAGSNVGFIRIDDRRPAIVTESLALKAFE